jgi:hypothetical protein
MNVKAEVLSGFRIADSWWRCNVTAAAFAFRKDGERPVEM